MSVAFHSLDTAWEITWVTSDWPRPLTPVQADMGGAVNVAEVSLLTGSNLDLLQSDSFVLATLAFDVVNLGPSDFTQLSVLSGPLLVDAFGSPLSVTSMSGASVRGVSSPGTLMLLAASMLGWLMVRCRQPT